MTKCACRSTLTEADLFAARTIGVRIKHDAEPCLLNESGEAGKLGGVAANGDVPLSDRYGPNRQEPNPNEGTGVDERPGADKRSYPSRVVPAVIAVASSDSTRPVLTRLPRLTVVGR